MSEQKMKRQRIYDVLNAEIKPNFLCLPYIKQRKSFLQKKSFLRNRGTEGLNIKRKEGYFNCFRYGELVKPYNVEKKTS